MDKLKIFLEKTNFPMKVFISENQTYILQRIEYDSTCNKLIGFVPPICKKSGLPKNCNKFVVNNLKDMETAKNVYIFMAQPLIDKSPLFVLAVFGSDNTGNSKIVMKRWKFIRKLAEENNIKIVGYSSDGDPRCLKAMRMWAQLPSNKENPYSPYVKIYFQITLLLIKI